MAELDRFALLDRIADSGFTTCIFSTYNIHFPFFEEVVLRRLRATGCQHSVVLVDASQLAACLADRELRPRLAGVDYTIVPVQVGGVFHPKVVMRLGKKKGALHVGSHNLTFSGCAHNHEVTSFVGYDGDPKRENVAMFQAVLDELRHHVASSLPGPVEAFEAAVRAAPWLRGPAPLDPNVRVLASHGDARSVWTRVQELVRGKVTRALVVGPFFDSDLGLLAALARDLAPAQGITVAVDPASVSIRTDQALSSPYRFVDVSQLLPNTNRRPKHHAYLHAKILWLQTDAGELLITGSANPTPSAFLLDLDHRNAEMVISRWSPGTADALLRETKLEAFLDAPAVSETQWAEIRGRLEVEPTSEPMAAESSQTALIAETTPEGFLIAGTVAEPLIVIDSANGEIGLVQCEPALEGRTPVRASAELRDAAAFLVTQSSNSRTILVHRSARVAELYGNDTRRALRLALGRLDEDPNQLESLLQLTEKVIFDSGEVTVHSTRTASGKRTSPETSAETAGPTSLAVDAQGRRSASKERRRLASGDLAVLLDALIRRLGQGLAPALPQENGEPTTNLRPDDDDGDDNKPPVVPGAGVDRNTLAKYCRRRTKLLLRRCTAQIEKAAASTDDSAARTSVVQLAAVLAVLRALAVYARQPEWRHAKGGLVDRDAMAALLERSTGSLSIRNTGLLDRALADEGDDFEELSLAAGLLIWCAWEVDAERTLEARATAVARAPEERWRLAQGVLFLAPWFDEPARNTATDAVRASPRRDLDHAQWLRDHEHRLILTKAFDQGEAEAVPAGACTPGDLVVLRPPNSPRVRVALAVAGSTVTVLNLDGRTSRWAGAWLSRLARPTLRATGGHNA